MWMRHSKSSCFTDLISWCNDLRAVVVRLCSHLEFKKERSLVLETCSTVSTRSSRCPVVAPTTHAGQEVWMDRVSPFKKPSAAWWPSPPTPPPCQLGVVWGSCNCPRQHRRTSDQFFRAVEFASDMAEVSPTQVTGSSTTGIGASASITTPPFPTSAPVITSASAGNTLTSPSDTLSRWSSHPTSRSPSSATSASESRSSTRVEPSTTFASGTRSSHTAESSTSWRTSSTATHSSFSPTASSSRSSSSSNASASASVISPPPSSNSPSSPVSSSRTTPASRSTAMSSSTPPSSLSSSLRPSSSPDGLSTTFSPRPTSDGSSTTLSSWSVASSSSGSETRWPTSSFSTHVTSWSSFQTASSSSETSSPRPSTVTNVMHTTGISTSTLTSSVHASSSTGILRPGGDLGSGFANNTRAIVGVSVTVTAALIALAFLAFFTCRKYRSRISHNESTDRILALARNVSWRKPVDGSEDGSFHEKTFYAKSGSTSPPRKASYDHSTVGHRDEFGSTSRSYGPYEHPDYPIMQRPMNPTFGVQPYISVHDIPRRPDPTAIPQAYPFTHVLDSSLAWRSADPFDHEDDPVPMTGGHGPTHSDTTLVRSGRSSPSEYGVMAYSTAEGTWSAGHNTPRTRNSVPAPRPMPGPSEKNWRHNSTPPSAFIGIRDDATTYQDGEPITQDTQADAVSVKNIMGLFKSARRMSTQSLASTIRGSPFTRPTDHENSIPAVLLRRGPTVASPNIYSPSLLNPPIELPPQPRTSFSHGFTGHSYELHQSALLWPPATLPPDAISPVPTDNSSMIEGLLHPKLSFEVSRQASQTSFNDNEDYSRPINGLVQNHHLRSTTTIDRDIAGAEDGASTHRRGLA